MSTFEIISITITGFQLLLTGTTIIIALCSLNKGKKENNARYVSDIYKLLITDNELYSSFRLFDYVNNIDYYEKEEEIDKWLFYLENILALKKGKIISDEEFERFDYFIKKTIYSPLINEYFIFLLNHCKKCGVSFAFPGLLGIMKQERLFN